MRTIVAAGVGLLSLATMGCEGLDDPAFVATLDRFAAEINAATPVGFSSPEQAGFARSESTWTPGKWEWKDSSWQWQEGAWTPGNEWTPATDAARAMVQAQPSAQWIEREGAWYFENR